MSSSNHKKPDCQHSNSSDDDNDDFISFQIQSEIIIIYYSQFSKYSKHIRDNYLFSDVVNRFPRELLSFQQQNKIDLENIISFFQYLQQNFNIDENLTITYKQCLDLLKISKYLEVKKLTKKLQKYIQNHIKNDADFVIQMIHLEVENDTYDQEFHIHDEIENLMATKIESCLQNDEFADLPIPMIYRVIEKGSQNGVFDDILYDFIIKSISKFSVLFSFINLKNLSEKRLKNLYETFTNSDEKTKQYFNYLKCNLEFIMFLNENKKNLQNQLNDSEKVKIQLQKKLDENEDEKKQLQDKLNEVNLQRDKLQNDFNEVNTQKDKLIKDLNDANLQNNKLIKQLEEIEKIKKQIEIEKVQLQKKLDDTEKENQKIKKQIEEEKYQIRGKIIAKVKRGLLFNAQIYLLEKSSPLDTTKSKYIVSTINTKTLGIDAYSEGEPITSLNQTTVDFGGKAGTYYVRALIFNKRGESIELISNALTTKGDSMSFDYEGKASTFMMMKGRYKLEVWGGKGGDSKGTREQLSSPKGGLGGYSTGILNLLKPDKFFVYVGGQGKSSDSNDGSQTPGSFPDGGGTKTGHKGSYTSVPGTGGGSTSIRMSADSLYSRLIVAGGGGGASGETIYSSDGGYGGGLSGGNCLFEGSLRDQGAGTQTGSSRGRGIGSDGEAGSFGQGATGLYRKGSNSGGGGGGGWYGGGSGGYGSNANCSGGGGGSGWVFTEQSFNNWKSGDPSKASKFLLNSSFYLLNASTFSGNSSFPQPNGNGSETGHDGNGYAKIIPQ